MKRINKRQYTMIEVLAVCVIIMILLGVVAGGYAYSQANAKEAQTRALIARISTALETCKEKHGFYPPADNTDGIKKDLGFSSASSGSVKKKFFNDFARMVEYESLKESDGYLVDAYGKKLIYKVPGTKNKGSFDLYSMGPDMTDNTDDDIK